MGGGQSRGWVMFGLAWLVVVLAGLFVPLMDNDSAHHANIALRMYLTGDYVRLIDYDGPYLDKPHLHFWLSALSYHVFGVTGFAYKFPSLLFSIIGIGAVYRAGFLLHNNRLGLIAAVIYASSVAVLLSLNDVRMDAILSSCVAISLWQLVGYLQSGERKYQYGLALGMALGFCTKGHIAVLVPVLFGLFYLLYNKSWKPLQNLSILAAAAIFFVLISPVVYCYYLQFNLHPEVVVRGKDNINGVSFILWEQSLGRYGGEMGGDGGGDKLFFFHSFLWVFAPWSLLAIGSLLRRSVRSTFSVSTKSTLSVLLVFGVLIGFSSFKLPHYLNVVIPLASLWVAEVCDKEQILTTPIIKIVSWVMWLLIGVCLSLMLVWWFPDQSVFFWVGFSTLLVLLFYTNRSGFSTGITRRVITIGLSVLVCFWILNGAFYPSLLRYQGGQQLASALTKEGVSSRVFSLEGCYSSSFYFTKRELRNNLPLGAVSNNGSLLLLDEKQEPELIKRGIKWTREWSVVDYEITRLTAAFLNPDKRLSVCTRLKVVELEKITD